jgi:hypothetical protein
MKARNVLRLVLCAVLLLLAVESGLARGPQPSGPSEAPDGNAGPAGYGPWVVETVDYLGDVGSHVSVAISSYSGTTYISYYDRINGNLKMARYVGGNGNCGTDGHWSCETVDDSSNNVGQYSSIAINPTIDLPVISYYDATNEALKLAQDLGPSWYIRTIDDPYGSVGTHTSLKIDSSGVPHIAYYAKYRDLQNSRLFYATIKSGATSLCTNGDFQCVPIHTAYAGYTSLDLNSYGHIGIAYQINKRLMYARFVPSPYKGNCGLSMKGWHCSYIQDLFLPDACATSYVSLDHDDGLPGAHVASYCGYLHYAKYVGTGGNCGTYAWQCDEIDTMGTLPHTRDVSLVVDNAGFPIIAYHTFMQAGQFAVSALKVARPAAAPGVGSGNCGPQDRWRCESIHDSGDSGDYLAIAVNRSGLATMAYYSSKYSMLKVAYQPFHQVFLPLIMKNQ